MRLLPPLEAVAPAVLAHEREMRAEELWRAVVARRCDMLPFGCKWLGRLSFGAFVCSMDDLRYRGLVRTRRVREGHRWTLWYRLADEIVFLPDPTPVPEPVRIF